MDYESGSLVIEYAAYRVEIQEMKLPPGQGTSVPLRRKSGSGLNEVITDETTSPGYPDNPLIA